MCHAVTHVMALTAHSQTGGEAYVISLDLAGTVGPVRLAVRDAAGSDGASLLQVRLCSDLAGS